MAVCGNGGGIGGGGGRDAKESAGACARESLRASTPARPPDRPPPPRKPPGASPPTSTTLASPPVPWRANTASAARGLGGSTWPREPPARPTGNPPARPPARPRRGPAPRCTASGGVRGTPRQEKKKPRPGANGRAMQQRGGRRGKILASYPWSVYRRYGRLGAPPTAGSSAVGRAEYRICPRREPLACAGVAGGPPRPRQAVWQPRPGICRQTPPFLWCLSESACKTRLAIDFKSRCVLNCTVSLKVILAFTKRVPADSVGASQ